MIQLWLAKNATKLGIIGAVILVIFSCGFWTKSKLVRAKMDRMNTKYEQLERNYSIALEQNDNCYHNMSRLKESIASQNDAIIQLSNEAQNSLKTRRGCMRRLWPVNAVLAQQR